MSKSMSKAQTEITKLADQIMELKQQKQEKISKFLQLLEAEFDTKAKLNSFTQQIQEQMTGQKPPIITKKLQKYYELEFSQFLIELEKQKIKVSFNSKV